MSSIGGAYAGQGPPPEHRADTAEDVANAASWLASDESGHTSGHVLTVDAGITISASPNDLPPFFTQYRPMIREAGKTGLPDPAPRRLQTSS